MTSYLEKISLWIIYICVGITLVAALLIDNRFFFPFIFTKVLVFRLAVEIMLLAYLFLIYRNRQYLPRFNFLSVVLLLFVIIAFFSSVFGVDFHLSFWGDIERGEGLILWLHLLAYFFILSSVFRKENYWLPFFDFSLLVSLFVSAFALAQLFGAESILNTTGSRVASTIGNPAFLAAYLLLNLGLAIYLLFRRHNIYLKIYYSILSLLFIFIMVQTQTRGAIVGLAIGLFLALVLWLFKASNKKVRIWAGGGILIILVISFLFYSARNSNFIKNNQALARIASISLQERTAETRLATWQAAWQGVKERPFFGYGLENFTYVFDRHFPAIIYEDQGSQVWFDRAHNIIFDRAITVGIAGLIVYLLFIFSPVFYLNRKEKFKTSMSLPIIMVGLIIAFFVQDLFVFEAVTTYIMLFFVWSFMSIFATDFKFKWPQQGANRIIGLLPFITYLIFISPLIYLVNIKPAQANLDAATAIVDSQNGTNDFFKVVDQFKNVLAIDTYGIPEYRIQFIQFVDQNLANLGPVALSVIPILNYADQQVDIQLIDQPNNAKNYLLAMRHYNYTFASLPEQKFDRLQKALSYLPKLEELSPDRPQVYQEAGYSHLYLYRNYKDQNNLDQAGQEVALAEQYFNRVIDINPQVVESYSNLIMLYLNTNDNEKIQKTVDEMVDLAPNYQKPSYLNNFINLSVGNKNYYWAQYFVERWLEVDPENLDLFTQLALAYAYQGKDQQAIDTANKIKAINGQYSDQADLFIQDVKAGKYKN
ncbi:MAG: O-antigen ligase family protein [Candidatus Buchananbacteria bacterium]|nr:O-antigen ligase family protein [Candidatus Buchananbacteria bacterium]